MGAVDFGAGLSPLLVFPRSCGGTSRILGAVRHGFAGAYVTDLQVPTSRICGMQVTDMLGGRSRILDAEVAGSGVTDLPCVAWFWARGWAVFWVGLAP